MIYQDAEKFIKDSFWKESHDKTSLDLVKAFYDEAHKQVFEKDLEYYGHREGVVHVSSVSSCLRGVLHQMFQVEADQRTEKDKKRTAGVFWVGQQFEDAVIKNFGDKVTGAQTEYEYKYKNITLVGRSDFRMMDEEKERIGEVKTVNSNSFWFRAKEGNIVAYQNLVQLQIYLWLERMLYKKSPDGIFLYASKDDMTLEQAAVKYNYHIIDEVVKPALDIINEGYVKRDPNIAPVPEMVVYNEAKHQYQVNWLCKYCDYHNKCTNAGWILEAKNLVAKKNTELKDKMKDMAHLQKKDKPEIVAIKSLSDKQVVDVVNKIKPVE